LWVALFLPAALPVFGQAAAETPRPGLAAIDEAAARIRDAYRDQDRGPAWAELPIGVFDSGTGGLSVLEEILKLDVFDNQTGTPLPQGDGKADFCRERFVFLADQANMPYGNYALLGKRGFLLELIRNDALFLLGREYFASAEAESPRPGKRPIKALVIACNTATAYGKADLESLLAKARLEMPVMGVVEAGARGALQAIARQGGGTIGILATTGTAASDAYPAAIRRLAAQSGFAGPIDVVQQGSLGLAGAIDGAGEFIVPAPASDQPRPDYQGPSLSNQQAPIDPRLLPRYGFDFSHRGMLFSGEPGNPEVLQINSIDNYVRYEVLSLLESIRRAPQAAPLKVVVLACTHFPYCTRTIQAELRRLYDYQEQGRYVYREHMAAEVTLVDPAVFIGRELYASLVRGRKLADADVLPPGETRGEFYITVPYRRHPDVKLDSHGWFSYDYKYSRSEGRRQSDVRTVPLLPQHLDPAAAGRLARDVPGAWRLMAEFRAKNAKLGGGQRNQ
jgi:glutamate racemase